jgi:hypothetical protein
VRIYYAHCMAIYNTPQENRDVAVLEEIFGRHNTVVNPNHPEVNLECTQLRNAWNENRLEVDVPGYPGGTYNTASDAVMDRIFKPMVKECDALAFRGLPDGTIPSGVAQEIIWAREAGLPVIELPSAIDRRTLTLQQTRDYLAEIGQR